MASGRLEALGDGIFSVAMTFLVIELALPVVKGNSWSDFLNALKHSWDGFLCYMISFVVLGIMWFGHRMMFEYIGRTNRYFIFLGVLFYMVVCLVVAVQLCFPRLTGGGTGQHVKARGCLFVSAGARGQRALGSGERTKGVCQQGDQRLDVGRHCAWSFAAEPYQRPILDPVGESHRNHHLGDIGEEAVRRQVGRQHAVGDNRELRVDRCNHDPLVVVGARQ